MKTKIIEVVEASGFNYGKFLVGQFDSEWERKPVIEASVPLLHQMSLLRSIGVGPGVLMIFDLQTGEGALFYPSFDTTGIGAKAALDNHKIWCCPMMEPFMQWLYRQLPRDLEDVDTLPDLVDLGDVPTAFRGYRRSGPQGEKQ